MLPTLSSRISTRSRASASSCLVQFNNDTRRRRMSTARTTLVAGHRLLLSSSRMTTTTTPSLTNPHRRSISHTLPIHAQITIDVPTMGDSITEGTIVEWCVDPGTHVREGDVVALIETDKVTVDIKADQEGVLVKQLGEVEAEVEVGSGLYVLDTDVTNAAFVEVKKSAAAGGGDGDAAGEEGTNDVAEVNASLDAEKMVPAKEATGRVPSIHFLGKEGWKERRSGKSSSSSASTTTTTTVPTSNKPHAPTSITTVPYSSMYGRPPITEEEMEALILGGADEAPEVKSIVSEKEGLSGVVFVGGKVVTAGPRGVWLAE
mmetsp:Transcript_463/g.912  ORF Transcript_463/g.912 Transcript_463/m.912 type:complete len:318 (+) Transcript_463:114-1067(+)